MLSRLAVACCCTVLALAAGQGRPVDRHHGVWTAPPVHCPSSMIIDCPIAGNGNVGVAFGGKPALTTFYLAANSFWSSNVFVDGTGIGGGESEYYTQTNIGTLAVAAPIFQTGTPTYQATQSLAAATIASLYSVTTAAGCNVTLRMATAVLARETVVTNLTYTPQGSGCPASIALNVTLTPGGAWKYGPTLPSVVTQRGAQSVGMQRENVVSRHNAMVTSTCELGGQLPGNQLFGLKADSGSPQAPPSLVPQGGCLQFAANVSDATLERVVFATSNCTGAADETWVVEAVAPPAGIWVPHSPEVGGQPPSGQFACSSAATCAEEAGKHCDAVSWCSSFGLSPQWEGAATAQLYDANKTAHAYPDASWTLYTKSAIASAALLRNPSRGLCLSVQGRHLVPGPCPAAPITTDTLPFAFEVNATTGRLKSLQDGRCVTTALPNPYVAVAVETTLLQHTARRGWEAKGTTGASAQPGSFAVTLAANQTQALVSALAFDNTSAAAAVQQAQANLAGTTAQMGQALADHAAFWAAYWADGASIDLGPAFATLEGFYYGMHYQMGSGTRGDVFAPGLWGPWLTTGTPGWMGDYTLNYNWQAIIYGTFSDNRPYFAEPFFPIVLNQVPMGKYRATMPKWAEGVWGVPPGLMENSFDKMFTLSPSGVYHNPGYKGINFPTHIGPWKETYFASDWGQKNVAAFCAKMFIDYFDFTQDLGFLRDTAYPFLALVGEFYESYATLTNGSYSVLHSCAMERCGVQGKESGQIALSNNPPFDLAFFKRTFGTLLTWSEILDQDAALRPTWAKLLDNTAPYPLTRDSTNRTVFAQATLNPTPFANLTDGFPSKSYDGNARYPIVYFNAMHPGEDIDLETAPADLVGIARQTVDSVNAINLWSPTNGLCMAWPPAARVVGNASKLLLNFTQALKETMLPNFFPYIENRPSGGFGCNMEQSGATAAINDLVVSTHGHEQSGGRVVHWFPGGWPAAQPVAWRNIRLKGAVLSSGRAQGRGDGLALSYSELSLTALVAGNITVFNPFVGPATPATALAADCLSVHDASAGGAAVPVHSARPSRWRWAAAANHTYTIAPCAQP